jgi:hypothetical protein
MPKRQRTKLLSGNAIGEPGAANARFPPKADSKSNLRFRTPAGTRTLGLLSHRIAASADVQHDLRSDLSSVREESEAGPHGREA